MIKSITAASARARLIGVKVKNFAPAGIEQIVRRVPSEPETRTGDQPFFFDAAEGIDGRVVDLAEMIMLKAISEEARQMITEAIFQARVEARRLQRIGLLISFVMTQVNDAARGGRKQVRLDEGQNAARFEKGIFGQDRQTPAVSPNQEFSHSGKIYSVERNIEA